MSDKRPEPAPEKREIVDLEPKDVTTIKGGDDVALVIKQKVTENPC